MKKDILVVDDDPAILDAVKLFLEYEGFNVEATPNGEDAESLPLKHSSYPRLIILDMLLSGKDGRNIAKALKNNPRTKNIPIMIMSAHQNVAQEAKNIGIDDYLSKPFEPTVFLSKVKRYIH